MRKTASFLAVLILAACAPANQPPAGEQPEGGIVYSHAGDIWVMNSDGSDPLQLTTDTSMDFDPVWSPDGKLIAFHSDRLGWPTMPDYTPPAFSEDRYGEWDIYVMNVDGSEQRNITNNPE